MSRPITADDLIDDELVMAAQAELKRQLTAQKRVRKGHGLYEDVPDNTSRRSAAETILAYKLGRPETRAKNFNANITLPDGAVQSGSKALTARQMVDAMIEGGVDLNKMVKRIALKEIDASAKDAEPESEAIDMEVVDFG